jgi:hypothetical protein
MGRAGNDPKPNHGIARFHEKIPRALFQVRGRDPLPRVVSLRVSVAAEQGKPGYDAASQQGNRAYE